MDDQTVIDADRGEVDRSSSRRGLLRIAAGAAAGAGVAVVASKASPAAAADTEAVGSGDVNQATLSTEFVYGTGANGTPSTSETEIVSVDATDAPDDRDALHATSAAGNAVVATADEGSAVVAASSGGVGVVTSGAFAALQLLSVTTTPPAARTTAAVAGMIEIDGNEDVWLCVADGTPGTWRKISGPSTAGAFHPIVPIRVYDSRLAAYTPGGGTPMARLTQRIISVKDSHNAQGAVIAADAVPAGATAVALNVTVASPTGPNYLAVAPGDATEVYASTINWPGGFDAANGTIVKIDANRQVKVTCGDQAGSTHVVLDVTGYYV